MLRTDRESVRRFPTSIPTHDRTLGPRPGPVPGLSPSLRGGRAVILAQALAATPGGASGQESSDLPEPLAERAQEARTGFEGGTPSVGWGAIRRVDLDGDLRPDRALDESAFACSSAASLCCGTGGRRTHFLAGDSLGSFLNPRWDVVTFGRDRVVLPDVHGSPAGGVDSSPWVNAGTRDGETRARGTVWPAPPVPACRRIPSGVASPGRRNRPAGAGPGH